MFKFRCLEIRVPITGLGGYELVSKQVDHLFAAVVWIADQPLADRIDDEVEAFQRDLPDQHRAIVRDLGHVDAAIAALNRYLHERVDAEVRHAVRRPSATGSNPI